MANTREIRRRIKSVKNTRQITKAMELVAASKMKKAQQNAAAGQPYAALLAETMAQLAGRLEGFEHPYFQRREVRKRGIIIVTTDRGLAGPLNSNLFREASKLRANARFVSIGRKGAQFLSRNKFDLMADFQLPDDPPYLKVKQIVEFMVDKFEAGEVDTVEVLYPRFVNTLVQEPSFAKLLPVLDLDGLINALRPKGAVAYSASQDERMIKSEPDANTIMSELLPLFIYRQAFQAVLGARASEHSARMVAMKTAKDNASNLLDALTLQFNKARQAAITQEILEIAAATASNS